MIEEYYSSFTIAVSVPVNQYIARVRVTVYIAFHKYHFIVQRGEIIDYLVRGGDEERVRLLNSW